MFNNSSKNKLLKRSSLFKVDVRMLEIWLRADKKYPTQRNPFNSRDIEKNMHWIPVTDNS